MFEPLTIELKLELLSKMTDSIKRGFKKTEIDKKQLLNELCGAWSDVNEEKIIADIYGSRTISNKEINLD